MLKSAVRLQPASLLSPLLSLSLPSSISTFSLLTTYYNTYSNWWEGKRYPDNLIASDTKGKAQLKDSGRSGERDGWDEEVSRSGIHALFPNTSTTRNASIHDAYNTSQIIGKPS